MLFEIISVAYAGIDGPVGPQTTGFPCLWAVACICDFQKVVCSNKPAITMISTVVIACGAGRVDTDLTISSGSCGHDLPVTLPLYSRAAWCASPTDCMVLVVAVVGIEHGGQCAGIFGRRCRMVTDDELGRRHNDKRQQP